MSAVHPSAALLADHQLRPHVWTIPPGSAGVQVTCRCNGWSGWDYDHPAHLAAVLAEAGLLADGTGGRFAEFSVHGDGNSDAWLWHEPCRTELDAIGDPWTLVELVASARSHLGGCVGAS